MCARPREQLTHHITTPLRQEKPMSTSTTNPNKALWEKGDFTHIAQSMRDSGETLVRDLGIAPGMRVLDVGCGDGTTAVPAAQLGADVLGRDIASNVVAAGNASARASGLDNLTFQEGDASDLKDLGEERFHLVLSILRAMFAPAPFDVAKELVRLTPSPFEAGSANGREAELQAELYHLFNEQNRSDTATSIPATFLRVDVRH